MLTQKEFVRQAKDRAVLWIDPATVPHSVGTKWPVGKRRLQKLQRILPKPVVELLRPAIKRREPFAIPSDAFRAPVLVDETERYARISDFIACTADIESSLWYRDLVDELAQTGTARYKYIEMHSREEIADFLINYVGGMLGSLKTEGYRPQKGGYESTAVIGSDGRLFKTGSGNHRFCAARALGLDRYPLRVVGAHEDWLAERFGSSRRLPGVDTLLEALRPVELAHGGR